MAEKEDTMSGELKISYSRGNYHVVWTEGYRKTGWDFTAEEFGIELLKDIITTVDPNFHGPLFLQPVLQNAPNPGRIAVPMSPEDRAAREAEISLRNGGAALGPNGGDVALDAPAYEDKALKALTLPGDWNPVDLSGVQKALEAAARDEFGE